VCFAVGLRIHFRADGAFMPANSEAACRGVEPDLSNAKARRKFVDRSVRHGSVSITSGMYNSASVAGMTKAGGRMPMNAIAVAVQDQLLSHGILVAAEAALP